MRQIILDTETTGLSPKNGDRLIEIGCVEMVNRKLTGNNLHLYINPQRQINPEAIAVHGITNEELLDKPLFTEVAGEIIDYLTGSQLVIHNAAFDVGFLDYELKHYTRKDSFAVLSFYCSILDTLAMARKQHPGQRNSLDALCKRYEIDNTHRQLHGALLDAELLARVYLAMTGGQKHLALHADDSDLDSQGATAIKPIDRSGLELVIQAASTTELAAHGKYMEMLTANLSP